MPRYWKKRIQWLPCGKGNKRKCVRKNQQQVKIAIRVQMNSIRKGNRRQFSQPGVTGRDIKTPNMMEASGTRGDIQHQEWEVRKKRLGREKFTELIIKAEVIQWKYGVQDKIQGVKQCWSRIRKRTDGRTIETAMHGISREIEFLGIEKDWKAEGDTYWEMCEIEANN